MIGEITSCHSDIKYTYAIDVTPRIQSLLQIQEITAAAAALVVADNSNLVIISSIQIFLFQPRCCAIADGFFFPFSGLTIEMLGKIYSLPFTIILNGGGGSKGRPTILNNRLCLFSIVTVHGINQKIVSYLFLNSSLDDLNLGTPWYTLVTSFFSQSWFAFFSIGIIPWYTDILQRFTIQTLL